MRSLPLGCCLLEADTLSLWCRQPGARRVAVAGHVNARVGAESAFTGPDPGSLPVRLRQSGDARLPSLGFGRRSPAYLSFL